MKQTLLLLLLALCISSAKASDTLTVRQVYNFNVGDTFDYKIYSSSMLGMFNETPMSNYSFQRNAISYKYLSGDTLIYHNTQIYPYLKTDTVLYTHLDSPITYTDTSINSTWNFSTGISVCDTIYNEIDMTGSLIENGTNNRYAPNLGIIYSNTWFSYPPSDYSSDSSVLIYYSNAGTRCGTPYTEANHSSYIHYKPIPEDCAVWTKQAKYPPISNTPYSLYEQIRTSTKHYQNSHTYVELIYRSYDSYLNAFTNDSLIGYFRNDTINRKILFRDSLNGADITLYDFTLVSGDTIATNLGNVHSNTITLDTLIIGGQSIDIWKYTDVECCYTVYNRSYAEGIGGLQGFIINKSPIPLGSYQPDIGSLISFCVCGQTLYPDTATGQCSLLTGIANIFSNTDILLSPNPSTSTIHLSISELNSTYQFTLTTLLGQEVFSQPVTQTESSINIASLSSGIYLWRLTSDGQTIKTGKLVKE